MEKTVSMLTILFEEPFWVGIYEREFNGKYEVCKITFGTQPKDYEVYSFITKNFSKLRFSPTIEAKTTNKKRINPKRLIRDISRQLKNSEIGTKAQQALKLQYEQNKLKNRSNLKQKQRTEKEFQFKLKQQKHKEKHRGH